MATAVSHASSFQAGSVSFADCSAADWEDALQASDSVAAEPDLWAGTACPIGQPSDEALVTAAIAGSPDAFDALVCRHRSMALRTATLIVGPDRAEDVVQDAWLLAFRALPTIKDRTKFPRWFSAVTRFRALRVGREESHYRAGVVPLDDSLLATVSDLACAPREEKEGDDLLLSALARIPPEYAETIRLHFFHGLRHQKIADFLAVPVSTVKWRCFRGKQMLRDALRSPFSGMPEKRHSARKKGRFSIRVEIPEPVFTNYTYDLALEGLFIRSTRLPELGSPVTARLSLPDGERVALRGRVLRIYRASSAFTRLVPTGFALGHLDTGAEYSRFLEAL